MTMKLLARIIGGILLLLIVLVVGLFIYLNDERLRQIIVPQVEQTIERSVEVDRLSLTFFRTFPRFGISIEGFRIPDDEFEEDLLSFRELTLTVNLRPLFNGRLEVDRLDLVAPVINYVVFPDGTTSFDFLFTEDEGDVADASQSAMSIEVEHVRVREGTVKYIDLQDDVTANLYGLDVVMSLKLDDLIEQEMDVYLSALSFSTGGTEYLSALPLRLRQTSTLDTENEILTIHRGIFGIRGLDLDMSGSISGWSKPIMDIDLAIRSSSDDFAALLDLVPEEYQPYLHGVQARGSLVLHGAISGGFGEGQIPDFNLVVEVDNGFLKHDQAELPIESVRIKALLTNALISVGELSARAGPNTIDMSGEIRDPLEDRARFEFRTQIDMDLGTVESFYPVSDLGVQLAGKLDLNALTSGLVDDIQTAQVNAEVSIVDGMLRYTELPHPIMDVQLVMNATRNRIQIRQFRARAIDSIFEADGSITEFLDPDRTSFTLRMNTALDLTTIPKFYPVNPDSLQVAGYIAFNGTASGRISDIENVRFDGRAEMKELSVTGVYLPATITNATGRLQFTDKDVRLSDFTMNLGASDYHLDGRLTDWRNLFADASTTEPARLTASYRARKLNIDEYIDWDEESTEPFIVELPNLVSQLNARIDSLIVMGIPVTSIEGQGETDPRYLRIRSATAKLFGGHASGRFEWEIYEPEYTFMHYIGRLEDLRVEQFFSEFQMGGKSNFHRYVSGGFNAEVDYKSGVDAFFNQDPPTIQAQGTFGITRARLREHPIQNALSSLLSINEFRDMSMDTWNARFVIQNGVMTLTDMNLTSRDIGLVMNGTQNLVNDQINYKVRLRIPERYSERIARLITSEAVAALRQEEGIIILPLVLTGTSENPRITVDTEVVQSMVTEYLRRRGTDQLEDAARRILRGLRNN